MGKIKLIHIIIALFLVLGSIMVIYLIVDMFIDHNSELSFCYYGGQGKDIHFTIDDCYFNSEINYNERIKEEKDKIGRLKIFPNEIEENFNFEGFAYSQREYLLEFDYGKYDYRAEIFLSVTYSDKKFIEEYNRISSISIKNNRKPVLKTDLFQFPTLVATYNDISRYEYAIFNYDFKQIVYIYLFDNGVNCFYFDEKFIPTKITDFDHYDIY